MKPAGAQQARYKFLLSLPLVLIICHFECYLQFLTKPYLKFQTKITVQIHPDVCFSHTFSLAELDRNGPKSRSDDREHLGRGTPRSLGGAALWHSDDNHDHDDTDDFND
jgi:hypothetical protein